MILDPGSFRVADYRKAMSWRVKCEAMMWYFFDLIDYARVNGYQKPLNIGICSLPLSEIEFDHDPALTNRPYDTEAGDFIPQQNDPRYIVPKARAIHDQKTFGRVAGAAKTVTTRSSDVGERARTADLKVSTGRHRAAMERKAGRHEEAEAITAQLRTKRRHTRPKSKIVGPSKIAQRATPWPKRKFRT